MPRIKNAPGKPLFSIPELCKMSFRAFRSAGDLARGRKSGLLPETLQERIMLAVTAVNRCAMCSYAHAEMALKAGLSPEEIRSFTDGEFPDLPEEDLPAVLFAQHYADSRGNPSEEAWNALRSRYGEEKSRSILGAARVIMLGNGIGIVFSSLRNRFRREGGDPRSRIGYEAAVLLCLLPILLLSILPALASRLLGRPVLRFS